MSKQDTVQRVLGPIPENIVWGRRPPNEETQLSQFFRWVSWVADMSIADMSVAMGLGSTVFFWNMRLRPNGASPGFLLKAYAFLQEEIFPGCPMDIRQLKLLSELTGDAPDRWQALVGQIQSHYRELTEASHEPS